MDMYDDSERRYLNDPLFHAAVDSLAHYALTTGVTPGELRQIAFYAALRVERQRGPATVFSLWFGAFYVCPLRDAGGQHSASNLPGTCQCGVQLQRLPSAANHTEFPYRKM